MTGHQFVVEIVLERQPVTVIARQLEPGPWRLSDAALLGEHMILHAGTPPAAGERKDLFLFELDLDPAHPAPAAGDTLELELA